MDRIFTSAKVKINYSALQCCFGIAINTNKIWGLYATLYYQIKPT